MNFKTLIVFLTLIALHFGLFKYSSNLFTSSELTYYVNAAKSAFANKPVEVSINDIDIQPSMIHPDQLVVALQVSEKNTGDSVVSPASFSLATQDGRQGNREVFYDKIWQPLAIGNLAPGQQKEGALFFEVPKSDHYTFTYNRGYQSTQYTIPAEEALFIPFVINPQ